MRSNLWPSTSRARRGAVLALAIAPMFAAILTPSPVPAQSPPKAEEPGPPSPERGLAIARTICKSCHLVDADDQSPRVAGIPTMRAIANKPGQTARQIENVLILPHAPMPDVQLTAREIQDIVAYLDTLRDDPSKPLIPPEMKLEPHKFPRRT